MRKQIFFFFYNLFYIFPLPLRKKTKTLTFSALFITGNRTTAREKVPLKIFLFFFLFLHPTTACNRKIYHLPFFSKFRLKVPKTAAKCAQVSFFQTTFSPVITRTHTPFHKHSVFLPIMPKKGANSFFLKSLFFCSFLLLLKP